MKLRSILAGVLLVCATALLATGQDGTPKQRPLTSVDEIAHVYHGVILDKNRDILTFDDANAPALLQDAVERLAKRTKRQPQSSCRPSTRKWTQRTRPTAPPPS